MLFTLHPAGSEAPWHESSSIQKLQYLWRALHLRPALQALASLSGTHVISTICESTVSSTSQFCEKRALGEKKQQPSWHPWRRENAAASSKPRQGNSAQRPWSKGINQDTDSNWHPYSSGQCWEGHLTSLCPRRCFFLRENNTLIQGDTHKRGSYPWMWHGAWIS